MEPRQSSSSISSPRGVCSFTTGRRHGPRSKEGCWTCRERKVKCDERRPRCHRCKRLDRYCDYLPRQRKNARHRRSRPEVPASPLGSDSPSAGFSTSLALGINDVSKVSSPCATLLCSTSQDIKIHEASQGIQRRPGILCCRPQLNHP